MTNKRKIGSFYTPKIIADFLVDYLSSKLSHEDLSILEPSAGDGIFIHSVYHHSILSARIKKVVAVEREKNELEKIQKITNCKSLKRIHSDFLFFQKDHSQKYDLVIGNPPYIKKSLLSESQISLCEDVHSIFPSLSKNTIKNIWTAFLVRGIDFVKTNGILAFVLPSELLQVKFAAELRELILKNFERVEIFTFNELLFKDCKGQDTILLIGEKQSKNKGVYYCNIDKVSNLKSGKFSLVQNAKIKESKWMHHHLETEEIELLEKLKNRLETVDYYCQSKAGIVTAANDFFIVDTKIVEKYSLHGLIKPIIKKGLFVNGSVNLTGEDFRILVDNSKPTYLIAIDKNSKIRGNARFWKYKQLGEEKEIHKRYKTSLRNNWFEVPNIGIPPDAFFFKRCNEYPKLVKNSAKVLATDSAYIISMKDGFSINNLIYSFYNSLTLAFAELSGRYYGGGVLELTPNEFKGIPVPYLRVNEKSFDTYVSIFRAKNSISEICKKNDRAILKSIDKELNDDTIDKLYNIREKLYLRRTKTN